MKIFRLFLYFLTIFFWGYQDVIFASEVMGDPLYSEQWYLRPSKASQNDEETCIPCLDIEQAWKYTKGRKFVRLTILELYYDTEQRPTDHPDFKSISIGNEEIQHTDSIERKDSNQKDAQTARMRILEYGKTEQAGPIKRFHQTQVLGLIAARHNNGEGIKGIATELMETRLMYLNFPKENDYQQNKTKLFYDIVAMNNKLIDEVILGDTFSHVYNCSFGHTKFPEATYEDLSISFDQGKKAGSTLRNGSKTGSLFILAAGNIAQPFNLAPLSNVIVVGAVNNQGKRAAYSNYGSGVQLYAPSGGVPRAPKNKKNKKELIHKLKNRCLGDLINNIDDGDNAHYKRWGLLTTSFRPSDHNILPCNSSDKRVEPHYEENATGTSMSAPLVAGIASLIISMNPELTAKEVKDILTSTANTTGYKDKAYKDAIDIKALNPTKALQISMEKIVKKWAMYWEQYFRGSDIHRKIHYGYYDHSDFVSLTRTSFGEIRKFDGPESINDYRIWMSELRSRYNEDVTIHVDSFKLIVSKEEEITVSFSQTFQGRGKSPYTDKVIKTITFILRDNEKKDGKWWYIKNEGSELVTNE